MEQKLRTDWHVNCVVNDPEFIAEFNKVSLQKARTEPMSVYEIVKNLNESRDDMLTYLLKKYGIGREDVAFNPFINKPTANHSEPSVKVSFNENCIFTFGYDITKKDLDKAWKQYHLYRVEHPETGYKASKDKSPENTELLYAIFKQRMLSPVTSFTEIYNLYDAKRLPGYSGGNLAFNNAESLRRYYRKYYQSDT